MSTVTFFVINHCEHAAHKENCKFCTLDWTYKNVKNVKLKKSETEIAEVIACTQDDYLHHNFIGGSLYNTDKEVMRYIEIINFARQQLSFDRLNGYVISMPPKDESILSLLYNSGISGVKFNLEVSSPDLFSKLCPAKSRFGYELIEERLTQAAKIFGINHVYTNLIIGLEPIKNVVEKAKILSEFGVGLHPQICHSGFNNNVPTVTMDVNEIFEASCAIDEINKKCGLKPWLDKGSSRGCILWELYLH